MNVQRSTSDHLESEVKSTREIAQHAVEDCVAIRARMISRALTNLYNQALRPYAMRVTQRAIIAVIALEGEITPKRLSQLTLLEASTISRNIERMKSVGWLETRQTNDGRSHNVRLTEAGTELLAATEAPWQEAQEQARQLLGQEPLLQMCSAANHMWQSEQEKFEGQELSMV